MKKFSKFVIHNLSFILFFLFVFTLSPITYHLSLAFGAPHISGKHIPGQPKDHVHKIPDVRQLRAIGLSPKAIREAIGATGVKKVAVILVWFPSAGTTTSGQNTIDNFTQIKDYLTGLTTFYREVSYNGALDIQVTPFPNWTTAYQMPNPMQYYGASTIPNGGATNDVYYNTYLLFKNALEAAGTSVSTGTYDAVMVLHSGYGQESGGKDGDIWSMMLGPWTALDIGGTIVNGFNEGTVVPALELGGNSPFGVICHEFGHQLGLPDLYNSVTGATQVGKWCLMDFGTWAVNGSSPSHPSIWCKDFLSWVNPIEVSISSINCTLSPIEISSQAIKIPVETGSGQEYFLLEYRRKNEPLANYDKGLPGEGILIWHIDDTIGSVANNDINNYTTRRVDLEEADSSDPSTNYGDSNDPWKQTTQTFSAPQSNANNTTLSGVTVTDFTGSGGSAMSFNILKTKISAEVTVAKAYNFPNPFPIPAEQKTTIKFTLTRPTTRIEVRIYNLPGELVYTIPYEKIKIVTADDYKYVYQTDPWEGMNQEGEKLASGVYFYVIKADKETKVGKLAIIR